MTRVALLWHMHQPYYEDLVTREHIMPWVRLHALKDYYGMVALAGEFPSVRMTFNLVPSLLVQLEAFAAGRARGRYLDLGLKPAEELTVDDATFMLQNFFHAQHDRMIRVYPRYAELLERRGPLPVTRDAVRRFDTGDLRDLQVWQKLAWVDPGYLARDGRVRTLIDKGAGFSEADKASLRNIELELLNAVVPAYRTAWASGQIEVSASPFYHPILPLLCDTTVYRRTHPDAELPQEGFARPEDAFEQLTRASAYMERVLGRRPVGLWPSEGSVSDAMVPLVAKAGFTWMATDELILSRTTGLDLTRDAAGHLERPEGLYRPYAITAGGARVACVFRDHVLSDLIGFTYAGWPADQAAEDFVGRLVEGGRRYAQRTQGGEALITVILDGENAWEHYEGGGRPFLRALYRRLSEHAELRTVTMSEACAAPTGELAGIFPGSWIDGNFYIWIGHRDDRRAWTQLAAARRALDSVPSGSQAWAQAREEVLIAEGSDWFWWYGDDHSSEHDAEFDELFRRHLRNVYSLLGRPVPDDLFAANISTDRGAGAADEPMALLSPTIDGQATSYFEWLGAGIHEARSASGAMHRANQPPPVVEAVRFGFDRERFYLRVDTFGPARDVLASGTALLVKFLEPAGRQLTVRGWGGEARVEWNGPGTPSEQPWPPSAAQPRGAAAVVCEISVPRGLLGQANDPVAFFVTVEDAEGRELERHPGQHPIRLAIPDEAFEARAWTV